MGCTHSKDSEITDNARALGQADANTGNVENAKSKTNYPQYPKVSAPRINSNGEMVKAYDAGPKKGPGPASGGVFGFQSGDRGGYIASAGGI